MQHRTPWQLACVALSALLVSACVGKDHNSSTSVSDPQPQEAPVPSQPPKLETATLGAGCYWCVEAVLEQVDGIHEVSSGFMGGEQPNPTYREIGTGLTGYAEVVQVQFDPGVLPYAELLDWFWRLHDPTTLNRQGADVGTQYRSVIFVRGDRQREEAQRSMQQAGASFTQPIVTEIAEAGAFYPGPADHQDYYAGNREGRYCQLVIRPKLKKLGLKE